MMKVCEHNIWPPFGLNVSWRPIKYLSGCEVFDSLDTRRRKWNMSGIKPDLTGKSVFRFIACRTHQSWFMSYDPFLGIYIIVPSFHPS